MSESHQHTVDSRYENVPTDHLDRAWPDTGRNASEQVAAGRLGGIPSGHAADQWVALAASGMRRWPGARPQTARA